MDDNNKIFSVRLIALDYYVQKPVPELDLCYSQFRAKEIKQVPIIRVFGSNLNGVKTSMHIHGVYPYFYVPYESKDLGEIETFSYQLAGTIDKAINITLGQATSEQQHVFKIQPVKGIPFYGFHQNEHQYLKIYMYNPKFIKRAANLLQNGAINNKNFQPHESHLPFILQFLIDYNLYGMDFLHTIESNVKYRKSDEIDDIFSDIPHEQIIAVAKNTISKLEVDIHANFILNRFELQNKKSLNSNPGIESIWKDEGSRRKKLIESNSDIELPPLKPPPFEERPSSIIADSEKFYYDALKQKLENIKNFNLSDNSSSVSSNPLSQNQTIKSNSGKFDLSKFLINAVYPDECTQNIANILNASVIENHSCTTNLLPEPNNFEKDLFDDIDDFNDDTLLNSFHSNNKSIIDDREVLEIMRQLEEEGNDNEESSVDLDSTLAPLSQIDNMKLSNSNKIVENEIISSDSENEDVNDFTMINEDIDEFLLKLSQTEDYLENFKEVVPQLDGGDDRNRSPRKNKKKIESPRKMVLKSRLSRYKPLEIITKSPNKTETEKPNINGNIAKPKLNFKLNDTTSLSDHELIKKENSNKRSSSVTHLRSNSEKKNCKSETMNLVKPNELISISSINSNNLVKRSRSSRGRIVSLDKTQMKITCNLKTPKSQVKRLKVEPVISENDTSFNDIQPGISCKNNIKKIEGFKRNELVPVKYDTLIKKCKVKLKNILHDDEKSVSKQLIDKTLFNDVNNLESNSEFNQNTSKNSMLVIEPAVNKPKPSVSNIRKLRSKSKQKEISEIKNISPSSENREVSRNSLENIQQENTIPPENAIRPKRRCSKLALERLSTKKRSNFKVSVKKPPSKNKFIKKKVRVRIQNLSEYQMYKLIRKSLPMNPYDKSRRSWSPSDVAREHDRKYNFFPEPGPSHIDYYAKIKSPIYNLNSSIINEQNTQNNIEDEHSPNKTFNSPGSSDNLNIISFYDKSLICNDSPLMFSDIDSPVINNSPAISFRSRNEDSVMIRPIDSPPYYEDVLENMVQFEIPKCRPPEPFYGNPEDKRNHKEIGENILSIPGNTLNDLAEYKSVVPDLIGIYFTRKKILELMIGEDYAKEFKTSDQIKEYLCSEKRVIISTEPLPPTRRKSKFWMKAKELIGKKRKEKILRFGDDSPIAIRRQKLVMVMDDDNHDSSSETENNFSSSPSTPSNNNIKQVVAITENSLTPHIKRKQKKTNKNVTSFNKKLNLIENINGENSNENENNEFDKKLEIQNINKESQSSVGTTLVDSQEINSESLSFKKDFERCSNDQSFGIRGPSLNNTYGFKVNLENLQNAKADIEYTYLTIMSLEIFVSTRKNFKPNPEIDSIKCIFYTILNNVPNNKTVPLKITGYIILNTKSKYTDMNGNLDIVETESELLEKLVEICKHHDPDILVGYEVEMNSWGYILDRGKYLNMNLHQNLSRVPNQRVKQSRSNDDDSPLDSYMDLDIDTKLCGRIILDVWRLMRSEIALTSYSFENVVYHILHRRCPLHTFEQLTEWYENDLTKWIVFDYYMERVNGTLEILDQLDLIGRTSEMAKLIGIQFYEVLSRGSQFRVESMMLRMAKPKNLIPLSPSVQQRAHMRAPEYLPLILEPQSRYYADPLIVLDFQSLYPSVMIAYNYCFSTCLGRVEHLGQSAPFEFGASQLKVSNSILQKLIAKDNINISPCGAVFVKSKVREGILPQMLREILDTRLMVKQSMKIHKDNSILQRVLHSRQLGLKLVANVTYGYTAANFSGRMPCVEVGDSVVAKGRECLERAIKLVESNKNWNAKVVYGDTDSLFVLCKGRSKEDSFKIGAEIAEAITNDNPFPIKLKLEKVYQPSILQTKKRYVGYMYESADQKAPIFEAKGIETVRRDGCPAAAKMLEKCLRILFETCDVSKVKEYVCKQFTKLLQGKANIQDLIFAKEFRGRCGYKAGACVPALELTKKWLQTDPRSEPRSGERVPYLIINGPPGVPLIRLVRSPYEYLSNPGLKINSIYYITKAIIPPLNRCMLLIGVDVNEWFAELPRKALAIQLNARDDSDTTKTEKKITISQYFSSINCICECGNQTTKNDSICELCKQNSMESVIILENKISKLDRKYNLVKQICESCCERFENVKCSSLDCPVLYVKEIKHREYKQIPHIRKVIKKHFNIEN